MHGALDERLDHVTTTSGDRKPERRSILDSLGPSTCALHGRRIPGARVDLDHVLVAPAGVFTIESRDTTARMDPQVDQLWVGHRSRTRYLDQARDQADAVRRFLEGAGLVEVPVIPTLCFTAVQWPLLFAPQQPGDVRVVDTRGLADLAKGAAALTDAQVWQVVDALDRHLDALQDGDTPPITVAPRPAPDALRLTSDQDQRGPDGSDTDADTLVVSYWKQAGKQRLNVTQPDGTPLGFVDLRTQAVVPVDPRHHDLVREAASKHLQDS